jgi:hypothetical protein
MVNHLHLLLRCLSQLRALHNVVATLSSQNQARHSSPLSSLIFPPPISTLASSAARLELHITVNIWSAWCHGYSKGRSSLVPIRRCGRFLSHQNHQTRRNVLKRLARESREEVDSMLALSGKVLKTGPTWQRASSHLTIPRNH